MFVLTPIVRKNFAAIWTKIYEKPTTTGFRAAGPRDNPTTGTVLHDCVSPGKHISQARSSKKKTLIITWFVPRWSSSASFFGYQKWFPYEAQTLVPVYQQRPAYFALIALGSQNLDLDCRKMGPIIDTQYAVLLRSWQKGFNQ